ncbi:ferritin family protein [Chloroflexota bacterium]
MTTQQTFEQILESAIQKEIQAQALYFDLSNKVVEENVKYALQELAGQEKEHQELLESYLQGRFEEGGVGTGADYRL